MTYTAFLYLVFERQDRRFRHTDDHNSEVEIIR